MGGRIEGVLRHTKTGEDVEKAISETSMLLASWASVEKSFLFLFQSVGFARRDGR